MDYCCSVSLIHLFEVRFNQEREGMTTKNRLKACTKSKIEHDLKAEPQFLLELRH